ncbi:MAG: hypothetical protein JWN75_388 [Candidatus Saccharibacteria bacterium]|nr:hypothetical protein [Candidatus Saccharibacteria bacterium]
MSNQTNYTINEVSKISGLPGSTLRYYEAIDIIHPIKRDESSKHRVYTDDDINLVISVSCLSATGMSIEDMREYLKNRDHGASAAQEQIDLLENQQHRLRDEAHYMELRQLYVDTKIEYWNAVKANDFARTEQAKKNADVIIKQLQESKPKRHLGEIEGGNI